MTDERIREIVKLCIDQAMESGFRVDGSDIERAIRTALAEQAEVLEKTMADNVELSKAVGVANHIRAETLESLDSNGLSEKRPDLVGAIEARVWREAAEIAERTAGQLGYEGASASDCAGAFRERAEALER